MGVLSNKDENLTQLEKFQELLTTAKQNGIKVYYDFFSVLSRQSPSITSSMHLKTLSAEEFASKIRDLEVRVYMPDGSFKVAGGDSLVQQFDTILTDSLNILAYRKEGAAIARKLAGKLGIKIKGARK